MDLTKSARPGRQLTRKLIQCCALACLLLPGAGAATFEASDDPRLADFTLDDSGGHRIRLADYRGRVVLVNFWASWCGPCVQELPALMQLAQHFRDAPFAILAVNVGENAFQVSRFLQLVKVTLPVPLDSKRETFNDWGVSVLPTSFLVDAGGRVRYRAQGDPGWDEAATITLIETLLAGPATTAVPP
jgi:thiol-disulfide isomerase/thioredoxin